MMNNSEPNPPIIDSALPVAGRVTSCPFAELTPAEAAEYCELGKYFQATFHSAERQFVSRESHSLKIIELFGLIAVVGVSLTLVRNFDFVGALIVFLLASIFSITASWLTTNADQVRFWNQLLWGMLVPLAGIVGDRFVFGVYEGGIPKSLNLQICVGPYFVMGYSMLLMALSWFLGPRSLPSLNALLAGQMLCGALILYFIGILLLPLTLLGMLSLLGLICLVPFISGSIYWRTSNMHFEWATSSGRRCRAIYLIGFLIFLLVSLGLTILGSRGFLDSLR